MKNFREFQENGLLWLINTSVFHPRGYALAFYWEDGEVIGWDLQGDGGERWTFADNDSTVDAKFDLVRKLMP